MQLTCAVILLSLDHNPITSYACTMTVGSITKSIRQTVKTPRFLLLLIIVVATGLRLWQLSRLPSGLYWDEMDVGYQAFSFLKTGKDYFGNFLPIQFHSFAEYRTSLYIYATVPFVALFGLTAMAVRLPAVIFSIAGIVTTYFLAKEYFKSEKWAWLPCLVLAVSPWYFQYSRMAFEVVTQLPLAVLAFYSFLRVIRGKAAWLIPCAVCFGLLPYTYSTAKLFAPLLILILIVFYWRNLLSINRKYLIGAIIILCLLTLPTFYENIFGGGNQRFAETSIFTDPTIASQINYQRLQEQLASGTSLNQIGLQPRLIDKVLHNKPFYLIDIFTANYLRAFSINFLFISGDPNLRQSPDIDGIGEMYRIMSVIMIFGFAYLVMQWRKTGKLSGVFLVWLLLAPIPSAITRDGGYHASRLFLMLTPLCFMASAGILYLFTILKGMVKVIAVGLFVVIWSIEILNFYTYYFTIYKFESAPYFNYGFSQAIEQAKKLQSNYDTVVIDAHHDSALMAYLFYGKIDPKWFQKSLPLQTETFIAGITGNKFGNIYILPPAERGWRDYFSANQVPKRTLLIVAADQIGTNEPLIRQQYNQSPLLKDIIRYPNGDPDFYLIEQN